MAVEIKDDEGITRLSYDDFETQVREGKIPPDVEIRLEAATGNRFVLARELELYQQLIHSDQMNLRLTLQEPGLPIITFILIAIQVRIYLWSKVPNGDIWFMENLSNWAPAELETGESYRLLTYGLLHVSFTHLAFNLLFLAYMGWNLERALGRLNMLALYIFSVFSGGLLSMIMSPEKPSLGASGGDFGLIAGSVIFGWKYGDMIPEAQRKYFGWAILVYLIAAFYSGIDSTVVDNWGHFGGLIGGALMVTILHPEAMSEKFQRYNSIIRTTVIGILITFMLLLSMIGQWMVPMPVWSLSGFNAVKPSYWIEGWTFTGDKGYFSPTGNSTLVAHTSVYPMPVAVEDLSARFLQQLNAGGKKARLLAKEVTTVKGWPAVQMRVGFLLSDVPHELEALLIVRGHYVHRIHLHTSTDHAIRYRTIWNRTISGIAFTEPKEYLAAKKTLEHNQRSWKAHSDWAYQLKMMGEPAKAEEHYRIAISLNPSNSIPVLGLLKVSLDYKYPFDGLALLAVQKYPNDQKVIITAAHLLEQQNQRALSEKVLLEAWDSGLYGEDIQRALFAFGVNVSQK